MEENRGLSLRSVIGELSSNIRATAPDESARMGILLDVEPFLISQDAALAVAFILTDIVEPAMLCKLVHPIRTYSSATSPQTRAIPTRPSPAPTPSRAPIAAPVLRYSYQPQPPPSFRVTSPAPSPCDALQVPIEERYGCWREGLSRQLRSQLHHEEMSGAFEISIAILGRD